MWFAGQLHSGISWWAREEKGGIEAAILLPEVRGHFGHHLPLLSVSGQARFLDLLTFGSVTHTCSDFDINLQSALSWYLKALLEQWPAGYTERVMEVVPLLEDHVSLASLLAHVADKKVFQTNQLKIIAVEK